MTKKQYFYKCIDYRLDQLANDIMAFIHNITNEEFTDRVIAMYRLMADYYFNNKFKKCRSLHAVIKFFESFKRFCQLCEIENFISNCDEYYEYKYSINNIVIDLYYLSLTIIDLESSLITRLFSKK
jgi:hypothetical protein